MFHIKKEGFPEREERILKFWEEKNIFKKTLIQRNEAPLFSFYDGPPFATGLPHYGHLLAGTIKDVVPRYKTMKGFQVPRRFGWDCHGLPVENEIEKAQELSGAAAIENYGIANFNEECRRIVLRYTKEWEKTVQRMGRWVDFEHTYRTMDPDFMETIWWIFSKLWEKEFVYEGYKVMPFSAKLGTPLSNFEANLNYQEVDDPSVTIRLRLEEDPNTSLLVWTTTPWTLVSNLAAIVNEKIKYVKLKDRKKGEYFILGKGRYKSYFKDPESYEVVETFTGKHLEGKKYHPPFTYFKEKASERAFTVLLDDFVGEEEGTGIVHAAPAFGETDFYVCFREKIDVVCPVDQNGRFTQEVPEFEGKFVKDADKEIIRQLKEQGILFHSGQIRHRYPFCWRSDTPLIYKAVRTWFVSVEKIKNHLLEANQEIHWVPEHIKNGRFGKWLENARDWAISRNRYWGTPIPIWRSMDGDCRIIGSVSELEEKTGQKLQDLHRHHIDDLSFKEDGKLFRRIPEVFDCWFESGSMPYAQNHFPFENEEDTMRAFPADFIAEGLDQTRGWFYTLTILAVALFDKPAFKNVIVNGIILAEDGNKMSKRLKNYPEPDSVIDKYGADAIRLYLLNSPVVQAEDLKFSERGVELVLRQFLIPLWNSFIFLSTYAKIYHWTPSEGEVKPSAAIDQWILSVGQKLIQEVEKEMDQYHLSKAIPPFVQYIDHLTNWYIRRCRPRFWTEEDSQDRHDAFQTLYTALLTLVKVAAPFIPFLTEEIYQQLKGKEDPESVHLCDFPLYNSQLRNQQLEREMGYVQLAVSQGHALRKEHKIKVRQPLAKAIVVSAKEEALILLRNQEQLICDELNVKQLEYSDDEDAFVDFVFKPNYPTLGKKAGPLMKKIKAYMTTFSKKDYQKLSDIGNMNIDLEGESFEISLEDILCERKVKEGIIASSIGEVTIALETTLNEELINEGYARELVNKINTQRRQEQFEVTDRVIVQIASSEKIQRAYEQHKAYISHEVLAEEFQFLHIQGTSWDLNGEKAEIKLTKA